MLLEINETLPASPQVSPIFLLLNLAQIPEATTLISPAVNYVAKLMKHSKTY